MSQPNQSSGVEYAKQEIQRRVSSVYESGLILSRSAENAMKLEAVIEYFAEHLDEH